MENNFSFNLYAVVAACLRDIELAGNREISHVMILMHQSGAAADGIGE